MFSSSSPLRNSIIHEFHSTPIGGHGGIQKPLKQNSIKFLLAGLKADVENFVKSCQLCQQSKNITRVPVGLLQPLPIPTKVWHDIFMDFITHLPSYKGNTTVVAVVDRFFKAAQWCVTFIIHSFSCWNLSTMICRLYGFPNSIVSDLDPIFTVSFGMLFSS